MRLKTVVWFMIFSTATEIVLSNPASERKFLFDRFINKIKQSMEKNSEPTTTSYTVRFVPLITLLREAFINFLGKYGQLNGINQVPATRNITQQDATTENPPNENESTQQENVAEEEDDDDEEVEEEVEEEEEKETELFECDANHLGLWPDKSNSQRFYKCEVDPRGPILGNCLADFLLRSANKTNVAHSGIVVPVVQPCFLLSVMKCANGFKYSHKTRICIPDVVFGSQVG